MWMAKWSCKCLVQRSWMQPLKTCNIVFAWHLNYVHIQPFHYRIAILSAFLISSDGFFFLCYSSLSISSFFSLPIPFCSQCTASVLLMTLALALALSSEPRTRKQFELPFASISAVFSHSSQYFVKMWQVKGVKKAQNKTLKIHDINILLSLH